MCAFGLIVPLLVKVIDFRICVGAHLCGLSSWACWAADIYN